MLNYGRFATLARSEDIHYCILLHGVFDLFREESIFIRHI